MALWKSGVRVPSGPLPCRKQPPRAGKVAFLAKQKRNVWDEMLEVGRRMLKELDGIFDRQRERELKPARVPVPARKSRQKPRASD